jgi:hypothetical protein
MLVCARRGGPDDQILGLLELGDRERQPTRTATRSDAERRTMQSWSERSSIVVQRSIDNQLMRRKCGSLAPVAGGASSWRNTID